MKNIISTLICLVILSFSTFANDVKVQKDMREKQKVVGETEFIGSRAIAGISEELLTSSVIIAEVIFLSLILFYWKKTRDEKKYKSVRVFKKNINAIRSERIRPRVNIDYTKKRKALSNYLESKNLNSRTITNTAKKLSISKGEVFMAARIMQLQNQVK